MDIKCRKTTCKYNKDFCCTAKNIKVDKNNVCKTYVKVNKLVEDTTKKLLLKKVEYAPFRSCKAININCDSKCLFNKEKKCHANGTIINDNKNIPVCITYILDGD